MDSNGDWWQIPPFLFTFGYWIDKNNPFEYNSNLYVQRDSLSIVLRSGWNIIPNPHLCSYGIEDFRFRINGTLTTFAEAMAQNLISRGVFVYRDGGYVQTNVIQPRESFLIKYYGTNLITGNIVFIPYSPGISVEPIAPDWSLKLSAFQDDSDADGLEIGCNSLSTDEFDFRYDLAEPLDKPIADLTRLYLVHTSTDSTYIDLLLNTDYRSNLAAAPVEEEKTWNFGLELNNTNPVQFTIDSSLFPENYGAAIQIGSLHYDIQHGDNFTYTPSQAGYQEGQIIIHNYFTSNQDETMPALTGLTAYPNPFNPQTNIAFYLSKAGKVTVDIYNVKGQRVLNLSNGILDSGRHSLTWNGKDSNGKPIASVVYFTRISTQNTVKTVKLLLLK
jgi:hypothetical protein